MKFIACVFCTMKSEVYKMYIFKYIIESTFRIHQS